MTKMTVAEIVYETVQFYNEDVSRRAVGHAGICQYTDEHGRHCAIGRCLIDENFDTTGSVDHVWGGDLDGVSVILDEDLKEQYRGHSIQFWCDLQSFHDEPLSWDEHGITEFGRGHADDVKRDHA